LDPLILCIKEGGFRIFKRNADLPGKASLLQMSEGVKSAPISDNRSRRAVQKENIKIASL
jgi:hypothetical protein